MARPRANGVNKEDVSPLKLYAMPKPSKEMRRVRPYPPTPCPILARAQYLDKGEPRRAVVCLTD